MGSRMRRVLPDNLDPLVDTLANVVGILVIVIVLTQIELGGALDRLAGLEDERSEAEQNHAKESMLVANDLISRRAALRERTERDPGESIQLARRVIEELASLPKPLSSESEAAAIERDQEIQSLQRDLREAERASDERTRYASALQQVPPRMVARLPDPEIVRGLESWILVRYGRVYPIDREVLFDAGAEAIRKILPNGENRRVRDDEFESVAHYLRKQAVGVEGFRWQLKTDPTVRIELEWASKDGGLDRTQLKEDPEWRAWLAKRKVDRDFIRFQVWGDSFETYLAARQAVEEQGFRAGWRGFEADDEMKLTLVFSAPAPRERDIQVD